MNKVKKILPNYLKYILLIALWIIVLISIMVVSNFTSLAENLIYWGILGLYVFTLWLLKLTSKLILLFSFALFILAGFFATFKLDDAAEKIMKVSFIGLLIGFTQSLFEYLFKKSS